MSGQDKTLQLVRDSVDRFRWVGDPRVSLSGRFLRAYWNLPPYVLDRVWVHVTMRYSPDVVKGQYLGWLNNRECRVGVRAPLRRHGEPSAEGNEAPMEVWLMTPRTGWLLSQGRKHFYLWLEYEER